MNLADAIAAEPPAHQGPRCGVEKIRQQFNDDERAQFDALLEEVLAGTRTSASVSRILARIGIQYSGNQLSRHMRRECHCVKVDDQ